MVLEGVTLELTENVLTITKTKWSGKRDVQLVQLTDAAAQAIRRALNNMEARNG
jgi:hypothetical protein